MSAPEFQLQKAICQTLAFAYPTVLVAAVPNGAALCASNDPEGRKRAMREVSKLKVTGMLPGMPDLCLMWPIGQVGFLEIKSEGGRLSLEQLNVHATLRAYGHRVAVCRSIEDLTETMTEWGVPSRLTVDGLRGVVS